MKYVVLFAMALVTGCGTDREIDVTIPQGVYGLLTTDNVGAANQEVSVYAAGSTGAFATATSDRDGVYQINLPNGDYTICTSGCTTITTPNSATVRYDWTDGPGGGTWDKI
ncbi:MAG: hypothetical protein ABI591_22985 [Kofleriaceae bacterium]